MPEGTEFCAPRPVNRPKSRADAERENAMRCNLSLARNQLMNGRHQTFGMILGTCVGHFKRSALASVPRHQSNR
jgi:hypothetical protein